MMRKRFLSVLLVLVLAFSIVVPITLALSASPVQAAAVYNGGTCSGHVHHWYYGNKLMYHTGWACEQELWVGTRCVCGVFQHIDHDYLYCNGKWVQVY